jgi:hypothetical protein
MNFRRPVNRIHIMAACCFLNLNILSAQNTAQIPSDPSAVKLTLTECEGGLDKCATWKFVGPVGTGRWPNGYEGTLVKTNQGDHILIHRVDTTGPSEGLVADYTGTLKNKGTKDLRISGEFTSSFNRERKTGDWFAYIDIPHDGPPGVIRECVTPGYRYCWTFTWNRDHYDAVVDNGPDTGTVRIVNENGEPADLRAGQRIIMHTQLNGRVYTSENRGTVSSEGNRIENGHWSDSSGNSGTFEATWGTAIKDLPRGTYAAKPPVCAQPTDPQCFPILDPDFIKIVEKLTLLWLEN